MLFAFNVGLDIDADSNAEGFGDSTLLRLFNAGDTAGSSRQFALWNKAAGRPMLGLTRRRAAGRARFEGKSADEAIAIAKAIR